MGKHHCAAGVGGYRTEKLATPAVSENPFPFALPLALPGSADTFQAAKTWDPPASNTMAVKAGEATKRRRKSA